MTDRRVPHVAMLLRNPFTHDSRVEKEAATNALLAIAMAARRFLQSAINRLRRKAGAVRMAVRAVKDHRVEPAPQPRAEPLVVMLVRNPYTHDTRVEKEARALRSAGYGVVVIADAVAGLPQHELREDVDVFRVERPRWRVPGLSFLLHEWRLSRRLVSLRPDVLHAHDSNALMPVAIASRCTRAPFVYDAHDLWLHRPRRERSKLYHFLQNAYYSLIERLLVPRAAATITVSAPIVRHLERRYSLRKVALVPNFPDGIDSGALGAREIRSLPGMEQVPAAAPIVLYLGGLMAGRGLENLIKAMVFVDSAHAAFLGSGHQREELVALSCRLGLADRVHLLDPVPGSEVIAYSASATIGVSPIVPSCLNYRYSLPNKLFQYMAAGIPVVASDFPQVRDVVIGSGAGLVVDTMDPRAIAEAINRLVRDPSEGAAMGARGRHAVAQTYRWEAAARTLLKVYARIGEVRK